MSKFNIGVICGHGHGDTGAISKKWGTEANLVRKIAPYLINQLKKYQDVQVTLLDTSINWYDYLQTHSYNFKKFDYVIELHANAGARDQQGNGHTTGIEIWVPNAEKGISVEETICEDVCKKFKIKNRGVKRCNFLVIGEIKRQGVSACLIENGFMDDDDDMKIIQNNIKEYAETIADAVASGFGLKPKQGKPRPKHKVAAYMTSYGNFRVFNLSDNDKIKRTGIDGLFNIEIEICGNRNMFDKYENGKACGKSHDLKEKGKHLMIAFVDELDFDINSKM